MKYTTGNVGRVCVIRLEDGDIVHECVEAVAEREGVRRGAVLLVGGADVGSRLVVGPEDGRAAKIVPVSLVLGNVHEAAAVGTLFPDESGKVVLHMHGAFARGGEVRGGCVRQGVKTWLIGEVVIIEITDCSALRRRDPASGFELLAIE